MMITNLKEIAVKKQKYKMAANIRAVERDEEISEEELEKRVTEFTEKLGTEFQEKEMSILGDQYKISDELAIATEALLNDACNLRCEGHNAMIKASEITHAAFEAIRKADPTIPQKANLCFIRETKTVIVISTDKSS